MPEWPDTLTEQLVSLFDERPLLSAAMMAARLSTEDRRITRNAIIGKLHRLDLHRGKGGLMRKDPPPPPERVLPVAKPKAERRASVNFNKLNASKPVAAEVRMFMDGGCAPREGISLSDIRDGQCRYIAADVTSGADTICCGQPVAHVSTDAGMKRVSWCAEHLRRVSAPVPTSKREAA